MEGVLDEAFLAGGGWRPAAVSLFYRKEGHVLRGRPALDVPATQVEEA